MPAMIAVTFLATGITGGLILFGVILVATLFSGKVLRKFRLYYWPRRSITLMMVSLIAFVLLALAPSLGLLDLTQISIFPILFLILLAEEFTRVQVGKSKKSAVSLTIGTLVVSILGASLMSWEYLQKLVLLNPEISFLVVLILNILIGRYGGWRLSEYQRFKSILKRRTS
jgi:membrane-bound ClpP family serine protease